MIEEKFDSYGHVLKEISEVSVRSDVNGAAKE